MRRGNFSGGGQMPAGMATELKSGAIAGAVADGMPVAAMNGTGPSPNPMHVGSGRLQEMPPAGTSAFQEMPSGGMTAAARPGAQVAASSAPVFAEMPKLGGAQPTAGAQAGPAAGEPGVIALSGEWRLHLTLRG
ncbi:MAG: hypothetical protein DI570_12955 [Phenylobacterium zucineum]|nr:MAG: hypothetical protein DI570_12955 [Phenylobacterium zucineum]